MSRFIVPRSIVFGSFFAVAAHAQDPGIVVNTPLASNMTTSNITRMACVDLDQNLTMDAVFLVGNTPYAALEPDYWRQYLPLFAPTYSFNDVCAAPGLGIDGSDAVACVGNSGLWLVSRQTATPTNQGALAAVRVDVATNLFVGCKRIVCDDINGDGTKDLIGVTGDGFAIRRAFRVGTAWSTTTVTGTFGTPIDDIEIVDWDGTGHKDIAVLRAATADMVNSRVEIRSFNVSLSSLSSTFYWTMPGFGIAMTKCRHRGRLHDQLAVVYRYGSPQMNWFTVCGAEAPVLPGEIKPHELGFSIGPVSTIELTSGHVLTAEDEEDSTAPYDVVVTQNFSPDQLLFANVSTEDSASESFSTALGFCGLLPLASYTTPYANFTSTAGIADFDGDGDGDILIPSRPSGTLSLFRNGFSRDESSYKYYFSSEGELTSIVTPTENYHALTISIQKAPQIAKVADRLIVMIYRQIEHAGTYTPLEEAPMTHALVNTWFDIATFGAYGTASVQLPIKEASAESGNRYHIILRPMKYDAATDKYTEAMPATKYVFTFRNEDFTDLVAQNQVYFTLAGGGGGGDMTLALDSDEPSVVFPNYFDPSSQWFDATNSDEVIGGSNGGQTSGGTTGSKPAKKDGTQTGGVVVVVVPDPFGTTTPPPRPRASTP